ncbi:unnamed protein product [Jaminaea pallidilutea]
MSSPTITLTPSAYSLLILHAARHPQATVSGLLLGTSQTGPDGPGLIVEKVVPLTHHWTELAVAEDVGLSLLEAHLSAASSSSSSTSSSQSLSLLGLYEAPSRVNALTPSASATRLATKIASRRRNAEGSASSSSSQQILVLDGSSLLQPDSDKAALLPFTVGSGNSSAKAAPETNVRVQGGDQTISKLRTLVREQGGWKTVHDLDDHLEDTSIDWLENAAALDTIRAVVRA